MAKAIKTKLIMWKSWGYCMAPRIFNSKKEAVEHAKDMRDMGYIFGYRTSPVK